MITLLFSDAEPSAEYLYSKQVHAPLLEHELRAAGLATFLCRVEIEGQKIVVKAPRPLGPEVLSQLRSLLELHRSLSVVEAANTDVILDAIEFGKRLIAEFGAENMALGYTVQDISLVAYRYAPVVNLLLTGSLKTALVAFETIPPTALVTEERKRRWSNRVREYLGMPKN